MESLLQEKGKQIMIYVKEEEKKYILFRIPFTVYFLWKDIRYNKYRLVVKEFLEYTDFYKLYESHGDNDGKKLCSYRYKII